MLIFHIFAQGCVKYNHLVARITKQFLILMPVFLTDTFGHVLQYDFNYLFLPSDAIGQFGK